LMRRSVPAILWNGKSVKQPPTFNYTAHGLKL
jgi:hypothetical protein